MATGLGVDMLDVVPAITARRYIRLPPTDVALAASRPPACILALFLVWQGHRLSILAPLPGPNSHLRGTHVIGHHQQIMSIAVAVLNLKQRLLPGY